MLGRWASCGTDEFIRDLLEVTGGGRARGFEDVRDHAIIRIFTEGPRITEISSVQLSDLPLNVIAQPFFRLTPLKGARAAGEGRIQPVGPATARSIAVYLRARQSHRRADSSALWLGTRNRGPMTSSGIYQMFKRRADQAGYDPGEIHPHMMRDTFRPAGCPPPSCPSSPPALSRCLSHFRSWKHT